MNIYSESERQVSFTQAAVEENVTFNSILNLDINCIREILAPLIIIIIIILLLL